MRLFFTCLWLHAAGELELSVRSASWSGSRSPEQRVPEAVQDLVLVQGQDCSKPSASLQWRPPANLLDSQDVSYYYIRISSKLSSQVLREIEVKGATTRLDFPGDEYLEPLHEYIFAVQAMGCSHVRGDWNMLDAVIGRASCCMIYTSSTKYSCGSPIINVSYEFNMDRASFAIARGTGRSP